MRLSSLAIRGGVAAALALVITLSCDTPTNPPPPDPGSVQLVSCPSNETRTVQALISPLGGTLSLAGTTIGIPAGALSVPTLITLTIPASPYMEIEVRANDLVSFLFNKPIGVRIDYSRCTDPDLSWGKLSVWQIDPQTKALIEHMGGVDSKGTRTISFTTGHLSNYAIAM
jgi:hypothetical protein